MLDLHAALTVDGDALVWARRTADGAPVPRDGLRVLAEQLVVRGEPVTVEATLAAHDARRFEPTTVDALRLPPLEAAAALTVLGAGSGARLPVRGVRPGAEIGVLAALVRIAGAAVLRQELMPSARWADETDSALVATWEPAPGPHLRGAIDACVHAMPEVVRALGAQAVPTAQLVTRFVERLADAVVRERLTSAPVELAVAPQDSLHDRWLAALIGPDARIDAPPDALDTLLEQIGRWQQRVRRASHSPVRLCLRLEEPDDPTDEQDATWTLRVLVQLRDDPSVLVDADDASEQRGNTRELLDRIGFHAGEHLLAPLGEVAHLLEPLADALRAGRVGSCELDTDGAHDFLSRVAPALASMGIEAFVPAWWHGRDGRWQVGVRAQLRTQLTDDRRTLDSLNLATLVEYDWRVALGDETLTRDELTRLAASRSGLVRVRGHWVQLDEDELRAAIAHLERLSADPRAPIRGAARTAPLGELLADSATDVVDADGSAVIERLARSARGGPAAHVATPAGLDADLRPYQARGAAWLANMARLGLGACLADDMGLGKTLQALTAVLSAWEDAAPADRAPTLLVCPTSVLTNWVRECERFTPTLPVAVHHGPDRARGADAFASFATPLGLVVTSYALLARDADALRSVSWRSVVLDEAQHIKNPGTRHAVAARGLHTRARVALTGTPVENHAGDLWSIMEFLNPGLLGTQADFRRRYLLPIQSGSFPDAVDRLRRLTSPFVMRRTKRDPDIASELPERLETTAFCTLTPEQVSLYEAIVREAEQTLRMNPDDARRSGIERRGTILATISKLKQVCNHPAHLLADNSQIAGRSGKLARLEELVETILDGGERVLVFTQFVAMGRMLATHLGDTFGLDVPLLHGGATRAERDRTVERFQQADATSPPVLVLSLKAGGSGLNLTAASHVVHFDRWWNPAVEQQASDRAHRIGQRRTVQVHTLVCAGTIEEHIDRTLHRKREVAQGVITGGEAWIGDLDNDELLDLLRLRRQSLLQPGRLDDIDAKEWQRGPL